MSINTYFWPSIHQNGPEILGVKPTKEVTFFNNSFKTDPQSYFLL
jgi:hypothetical protein